MYRHGGPRALHREGRLQPQMCIRAIDFPEPLDHALLQRLVWVEDAGNRAVEGQVRVGDDERQWAFVLDKAWKVGDYRIMIGTSLEDLAGNNVARPFEVDRVQRPEDGVIPDYATLDFKIGA